MTTRAPYIRFRLTVRPSGDGVANATLAEDVYIGGQKRGTQILLNELLFDDRLRDPASRRDALLNLATSLALLSDRCKALADRG